jgi:hypothetical protein
MRQRDKKSYPQYEGTILQWKNNYLKKGKIFYVKVALMDYNIGATLISAEDQNQKYTCYNGPQSPNISSRRSGEYYDTSFQYLLDCIRKKKMFDVQEIMELTGEKGFACKMAACAFSGR